MKRLHVSDTMVKWLLPALGKIMHRPVPRTQAPSPTVVLVAEAGLASVRFCPRQAEGAQASWRNDRGRHRERCWDCQYRSFQDWYRRGNILVVPSPYFATGSAERGRTWKSSARLY